MSVQKWVCSCGGEQVGGVCCEVQPDMNLCESDSKHSKALPVCGSERAGRKRTGKMKYDGSQGCRAEW